MCFKRKTLNTRKWFDEKTKRISGYKRQFKALNKSYSVEMSKETLEYKRKIITVSFILKRAEGIEYRGLDIKNS